MNKTTAFSTTGTVRIALYDPAIPFHERGFFDTGNTDQLDYTVSETVVDLPDARDPAGGIDASMRRVNSASGSIKLRHISEEALVLALWGKSTAVAATALTGEAHKLRLNRFVPSNHLMDMTKSIVVKKGATTLVAPGDYTVEENGGGIIFVEAPSTSSLVEGDAITYDYTPLLQYDIDALVQSSPLASIMATGENAVNGKTCSDKLWKVRIGAIKTFSRINNGQFGEIQIDYTVERDATITGTDKSKYYVHTEAK